MVLSPPDHWWDINQLAEQLSCRKEVEYGWAMMGVNSNSEIRLPLLTNHLPSRK